MKVGPPQIIRLLVLVSVVAMILHLPPLVARQDTVFNTYRALVEVDALARQNYIHPIIDDSLVDGAIRGMMLQLDPYSGYIAPEELADFERRSRGSYVGIGAEVGARNGELIVIAPIPGGPAADAGMRAGDLLVAVDGRATQGLSVFDIDELLLGDPGSQVTVTVVHPGRSSPEDVVITRNPVRISSVRGAVREPNGRWSYVVDDEAGIAYIAITRFHERTGETFRHTLRAVLAEGARGIVLDLRFNPGGLIEEAVAVADQFLDGGVIASTLTRRQVIHHYHATPEAPGLACKVAVLVNGATASAAEILAGALKEHGRAVVVGERTFGKGSVQRLMQLESIPAAVKLTYAYYRLPSGRIIHRTPENERADAWGVQPDVFVAGEGGGVASRSPAMPVALGTTSAANGTPTEPPLQTGLPAQEAGPAEARADADVSPNTDPQLRTAIQILREKLGH